MAGVDLQNGYLRIANELYDEILAFPFSKRELLIVLAVIRKTYGFGKKTDEITNWQLQEMTGIGRGRVGEVVANLAMRNVLTVAKSATVRHGQPVQNIGINKQYKQWATVAKTATVNQNGNGSQIGNGNRSQIGTPTVAKSATSKDKTKDSKDNNPQTPKPGPLPDALNSIAWGDYLQHRIDKKLCRLKPASVDKQIRWLIEQGGHDTQRQIIDVTIRNGWTGLFEIKGGNGNGKSKGPGESSAERFHEGLRKYAH